MSPSPVENASAARLSPATSAFLDFLRIAAAFVVFLNHDLQFWNFRIWSVTNPLAHSAVIVFFVLSGYVIAYSTFARNQDARKFAVARLSRLYSVVVPALVLTFILHRIGTSLNPEFYQLHSRGSELPRYALTALFLQNVWTFSASPPSNLTFWSLSYEFWYYALFGVAIFVKPARRRNLVLCAILCLITPDILLLLPCWLVGVAAYSYREHFALRAGAARRAFVISVAVAALLFALLPQLPFPIGHAGLWYSASFLSDWITALVLGAMILFFDASAFGAPPARAASIIRYGADHTFSLYLYHYPLMVFANATLPLGNDPLRQAACAAGVLAIVFILSILTEARRDSWRRFFEWCVDLCTRRARLGAGS